MFIKSKKVISLAGLTCLLALTPNIALAQEVKIPTSPTPQTSKFQKIEQPLNLKLAIILSGLSIIGAELWWFVFSKPK